LVPASDDAQPLYVEEQGARIGLDGDVLEVRIAAKEIAMFAIERAMRASGRAAIVVLRCAGRVLRILGAGLFVLLLLVVPVPLPGIPRHQRSRRPNEPTEVIRP
jgi:hypothetical protein